MSGGGCEIRSKNTSSSPGSPLPNHNSQNHTFETNSSSRQCPLTSPPACQLPSSCQPCSPSPCPVLKKKHCCQCIPGYCMCQPLPRNCNCFPPVHIDARANRKCSCDCPSSPECAFPPTERRFPRTKSRFPNAKLCCPFPRLPPNPKCFFSRGKLCLPPSCDPCTSKKCETIPTKINPGQEDSKCPKLAPGRPRLLKKSSRSSYSHSSRDLPPSTSCRHMSSTYDYNYDKPLQSHVRVMNRTKSSHSRPGIVGEDHQSCCYCTGLENEEQRRENKDSCENVCDSSTQTTGWICPVCLSELSSNHCCCSSCTPRNLCQDCGNEIYLEKVSEFCRKFEDKSKSLHQVDCSEQMDECFDNKNSNDNEKIPECKEACKEGNMLEIKSSFKDNESDEEEYIDQFEYDECTDYDLSTCNTTDNIFKSSEICKCEEVEFNQKLNIRINSLMNVGTNTSYQKASCSKKNLSIQKKISTSSNKEKLFLKKDSAYNCTDIAIPYNINRKTSKTVVLKSQDQFKSKEEHVFDVKPCTSLYCECHPKNTKRGSCNCKRKTTDKESEVKVCCAKNNSLHYREVSFFNGWNNIKNALVSYFRNRISPVSSTPRERLRNECQSHTPSDRRELRKMNLNEKKDGTKNSQPRGEFCFKMADINRLDSFPNPETNCNHTKKSKTIIKELDKIKKYNNDNISAKSDHTISRFSDRSLIYIQPKNNVDLTLDIDMQLEDDTHDNTMISGPGEKTLAFFSDGSTIIRNEDKVNSMVDASNDNLSKSSSNECLVHPGKINFTSDCKFRRNDNNGLNGSEEFKREINVHCCSTYGFGEIRKKETIQGSKPRKNSFQGIKFTTTKVQMH
ncbi:uncharacterized protein LOC117174771 [Belonocnema kinseyi]|uniref:uncharacterized protein LOC117174771 n=1 Tax=Belonocnema kinseyi TaxID=2817044 RepID=UPI00143CEB83|nr:uncharacterized protein LOC117174771 [Belonocnema kinseyi]XP_033220018.1 uncharacterized protein LOC117174771 [Belonocnema kinseyi]